MNYYEHHIRDYDAATAHLSWDQDMAYSRLLRWYYRKEQPLPADPAEVCRLVRATTKPQRAAVESVLREFFDLREDGWHKDTCDAAIARFQAGEPERAAKQQNEMTRLTRHRAERAALFGEINKAGLHLPYNAPISEVRALVERIQNAPATPATLPATGTATPATHLQRLPNPQSPIPNPQSPSPSTYSGSASAPETPATLTPEGNGEPQAPDTYALTARVRAIYPAGTYGQQNWIFAERELSKLLDAGEDPEQLVALTQAFRAQQDAKKSTGTQFVRSPDSFFGEGFWRGPFPLPVAAQSTPPKRMRTAHEIAALYPEDAA